MQKTKYINEQQCTTCGGACCKKGSGTYLPEDILLRKGNITVNLIIDLLKSGKYSIDFVDEDIAGSIDGRLYFLRPRHLGKNAITEWNEWGGVCIHHTPTGCSIPREERPTSCNLLVPSMKNDKFFCQYDEKDKVGKLHGSILWIPYNKLLYRAKNQYKQQYPEKSTNIFDI